METLLFKGSAHCKRGHGIQKLPKWILENDAFDFIEFFKKMFKKHFICEIEIKHKFIEKDNWKKITEKRELKKRY